MLDKKNLIELAKVAANADPKAPVAYSCGEDKFSYNELNDTLRNELKAYAATPALYRENQNLIFALMEETIDAVLPKKVLETYGQFAEVKQYNQGEKAIFVQRVTAASRRRAKQFITKVGLAGVYEVFKLDGTTLELPMTAIGGACQISFEEFLDGRIDMSDVLDIVMEALDEMIYKLIAEALEATVDSLQTANKTSYAGFDEAEMDKLIAVADSYGHSAIYCTYEFAAAMLPADAQWASDAMKAQKWNNGYIANYKGHNVIVLPQSFEDETNTVKVLDPSKAYVIPVGAEKPIKVAFEGQTHVREEEGHDWSKTIHVYKKVGVGAIVSNNICVYENTSLK